MLGYPEQNYTVPMVSILYTAHSIMTVLLNHTILHENEWMYLPKIYL